MNNSIENIDIEHVQFTKWLIAALENPPVSSSTIYKLNNTIKNFKY